MKLFQQLLVAPAALGLLAPVAAGAAELNMAGVSQYSSSEQVTSISQFSDVKPTDWAYQALSNLIERYGCVAGYPNGTYKGGQAMTRFEAAALLNACLDRVTEVTDELKKLMKEFEKELAILKGRVDGLEARVGELEANQFSTTTKLKGIATFVLGATNFGGSNTAARDGLRSAYGATTFNYDVRLNFDTSFTGKDLLRTTLRAGNFASDNNAFGNGGLSTLEVAFQEDGSAGADQVAINRLFYQFPVGKNVTVTVGGKVRQDDMLAMWPSAYPADTVLDLFTYAGAQGAYSLNLGAGAGIFYKDPNGFNASLNYVSGNAGIGAPGSYNTDPAALSQFSCTDNAGNPNGGIGTGACSDQTFTAQVGYAGSNWGAAVAYTYANANTIPGGTPAISGLTIDGTTLPGVSTYNATNSIGLSAYWSPQQTGWVPSISAGWGITGYNATKANIFGGGGFTGVRSQSWMVGLQWADAFIKGNALGMAVGQPQFQTSNGSFGGNPNDGNYAWEWWYKFQVTDNISVTPAIFYLSQYLGAAGKTAPGTAGTLSTNAFGGLIKTTFKF